MKKRNWIFCGIVTVLLTAGWFTYQKVTADTYEGMTVIPEQHKDIPLFDGLEPTRNEYVVEGNHWKDIVEFYTKELPKHGWEVEYQQGSSVGNHGIMGFMLQGRKKDKDWELAIYGSYFSMNDQTEVTFDKHAIYLSTTWIEDIPASICIQQTSSSGNCTEVTDKSKVEQIVRFINSAIDWEEEMTPREKAKSLSIGNMEIKVLYEKDKEVYLKSAKGIKLMKPESEFLQLIKLK